MQMTQEPMEKTVESSDVFPAPFRLVRVMENPQPHDSIVLKGGASLYRRTDIGEYRVVHRVNADVLEIVLVGKRNDDDVYKTFRRIL